jgi:uncharacterized membrane protein YgdD (TMEM256/DUF423 family)
MFWIRIATVWMFLGVALGAFGAHGFKPLLERHQAQDWWQTAVLYHFIHALGLFVVGWLSTVNPCGKLTAAGWCLTGGIILFSGSLYAMSLSGLRVLGVLTPIGGVLFLAGWGLLFLGTD